MPNWETDGSTQDERDDETRPHHGKPTDTAQVVDTRGGALSHLTVHAKQRYAGMERVAGSGIGQTVHVDGT